MFGIRRRLAWGTGLVSMLSAILIHGCLITGCVNPQFELHVHWKPEHQHGTAAKEASGESDLMDRIIEKAKVSKADKEKEDE